MTTHEAQGRSERGGVHKAQLQRERECDGGDRDWRETSYAWQNERKDAEEAHVSTQGRPWKERWERGMESD